MDVAVEVNDVLTFKIPVLLPVVVGVNLTLMVQGVFATNTGQLLVSEKSPPVVIFTLFSDFVLVNVTAWAGLIVPTGKAGKFKDQGDKVMTWDGTVIGTVN